MSITTMRLFVALDIEDAIRARIERFVEGVRAFAPDARWVNPKSLHVTLKFIGEQPTEALEGIRQSLSGIRSAPFEIAFRGHGFFPNPKAARVFWVGIEGPEQLGILAKRVDDSMYELGIAREDHPFSPHLTLARGGRSGAPQRKKGDRPNLKFKHLQKRLAAFPVADFGTMTAREFFLYQSKLSPTGSQYTKLSGFPLVFSIH